MAVELQQLLWAVLLGAVHLAVFGVIANLQLGGTYTAGPRDEEPKGLSVGAKRLKRAFENYLGTLPWFAIAIIAAHLAQKVDAVSIGAGWVYLAARLLYVPAYAAHVPFARSLLWSVATFAILTIVVRTLL